MVRSHAHYQISLLDRLRRCWAVVVQITRLRSDLTNAERGRAEAAAAAEASAATAAAATLMQSTAARSPAGGPSEVTLSLQSSYPNHCKLGNCWQGHGSGAVYMLGSQATSTARERASLELPASALGPVCTLLHGECMRRLHCCRRTTRTSRSCQQRP